MQSLGSFHTMSKACSVRALAASRTQHNSPLKGYSKKKKIKKIGLGDDSRNQLNKWVQGAIIVAENRFHRSLKRKCHGATSIRM